MGLVSVGSVSGISHQSVNLFGITREEINVFIYVLIVRNPRAEGRDHGSGAADHI